ncbi:lysine 2,3-aminomutase [Desulfobacula sp.]|uniref:KamA family radical SAM protein n=1 Tax=Desulfobacula sp. TaxID=2593537 RepID=UPI002616BEAB|nr:lysine 2,3-aminomutase [Desulfobacula sp.]
MKYESYTLKNYHKMSKLKFLPETDIFDMAVVGRVLPFKTNNYVVDELIDWDHYADDPLFTINFPQKKFMDPKHFDIISDCLTSHADRFAMDKAVDGIRLALNPHPAGQLDYNIPEMEGNKVSGIQHKYSETMLVFPAQGQTCHAYCTFCFRWPQFTGMSEHRMALKQAEVSAQYLKCHPEITDVLLTGGDPMIMNASRLEVYINALLTSGAANLKTIRIGTKSLSFWPYRYLTDTDSEKILELFRKVTDAGIHLSIMAHINHHREMSTSAFREAVKRIRETGAVIRAQSPVLNHVNAASDIWEKMWLDQVSLGIIPYYMFVPRNTGAHRFFSLPLVKTYEIFREAFSHVSGLARTVRGPSMSALPGKIKINGIPEINGKKVISMSFIQARSSDWVEKPFFAEYHDTACWINELKPAFGETDFFFERDDTDASGLNAFDDDTGILSSIMALS